MADDDSRRTSYNRCKDELSQPNPNFQRAQVFATLSVEEALREMAGRITWAADSIASAMRGGSPAA